MWRDCIISHRFFTETVFRFLTLFVNQRSRLPTFWLQMSYLPKIMSHVDFSYIIFAEWKDGTILFFQSWRLRLWRSWSSRKVLSESRRNSTKKWKSWFGNTTERPASWSGSTRLEFLSCRVSTSDAAPPCRRATNETVRKGRWPFSSLILKLIFSFFRSLYSRSICLKGF